MSESRPGPAGGEREWAYLADARRAAGFTGAVGAPAATIADARATPAARFAGAVGAPAATVAGARAPGAS